MKKTTIKSIMMLAILTMPLLVSCGGEDEKEIFSQVDIIDDRQEAINELCKMFGINAADYYNYWETNTKNGKIAISLANKNSNRLLVAIYDTYKKSVVFSNTDISFSTTISVPSYEEKFEGKLARVYPIFAETKNGFIIDAFVVYTESGETNISIFEKEMCIQNLLFYDGATTKLKQISASSKAFDEIFTWYDNSCVFKEWQGNYFCYTDKGEEKFSDKYICPGDNYILSYNEYINIYSNHPIVFSRCDILNPKANGRNGVSVWSREINLIDNYTSDVKVEHTIEDRASSEWSISSKFVWENGTTKVVRWKLDINSGAYKKID